MIVRPSSRNSPPSALEALFERHAADIYRYALGMVPRQADAEDVVQSTFLNAYRALERGERPRHAGAWLRKIALNVCREQYRRSSRRPEEISLEHDPAELVTEPDGPEMADILRALGELPFNQRAALVMREFDGRSLSEIAAALEISDSAAEALLFRARRALREQLEGTLTCDEAEGALSRQLDGVLPRAERGPLRAHLRACPDCALLARRMRAGRSAMRALAGIPVPVGLRLGLFGGSGAPAAASAGVSGGSGTLASLAGWGAAKVAVAALTGAAALGVGYTALSHHWFRHHAPRPSALAAARAPSSVSRSVAAAPPAPAATGPVTRVRAARTVRSAGLAHGRRVVRLRTHGTPVAAAPRGATGASSAASARPSAPAPGRGAGVHGGVPAAHGRALGHARSGAPHTTRTPGTSHRASGNGRTGSPPGHTRRTQTPAAGRGKSTGTSAGGQGKSAAPGQTKKASGG